MAGHTDPLFNVSSQGNVLMMTRTLLLLASVAVTAVGCARYQPHNGTEPYGYFSSEDAEGKIAVGYETWRPVSRDRACGFARQRIRELGLDPLSVSDERWSVQHEHTHFRAQTAYSPRGGDGLTPGPDSVEMMPAFVSARVIRRCVLTLAPAR